MADESATQTGVQNENQQDAGGEKKERPKSAREIAMEQIDAQRMAAFEEEIAAPVGTPTVAAPVAKEEVAPEVKTEAATQADAQAGEDLILDADTMARAKVRIKVDGVEELVPASKALAQYQKGAAADVRLAEATRLQREAQAKHDEAVKAVNEATTRTDKAAAQQVVQTTADALTKFKEAGDALYEGDRDKAAALFGEAVAAATTRPDDGRQVATQPVVDAGAIAATVKQQLSQERALETLFTNYPEIKADPDFQQITDKYINAKIAGGMNVAAAIQEAGDAVAEKFKLGRFKDTSGRSPTNEGAPTTREQKLQEKAGLDQVQSTAARASDTAAPEETAADVIAQIAASRPGAVVMQRQAGARS